MAKIDKMLEHMIQRGAHILRLSPSERPILELAGGHRMALSSQDLIGTVLDGLAKEVVPPDLETAYLRGEKVTFDHSFSGEIFQFSIIKTRFGTQIAVGRASAGMVEGPRRDAEDTSVKETATLELLVGRMLASGGSDLYLNPDETPILRREGLVQLLDSFAPLSGPELLELVKPSMPAANLAAFQAGQDTEFARSAPSHHCRLRVSLFHDCAGPSIAIRAIPQQVPDPETLGLSPAVCRLSSLNRGLVLLTGAMGSGKSTTLAGLLTIANQSRKGYIISIQDSIEFTFPAGSCVIRQREVGRDPERQKQAIRAAIRQAPDLLAVGELRDAGVIELALQAAQTGAVVFATLATTTLTETLFHLVDPFPSERRPWITSNLADSLKAIVGHTLLKKASGGRVAAIETLFNNPAIATLIREGRLGQVPGAMKGGRYGQVAHNDALLDLIRADQVEPMEAYLRCQDRESFIAACKKADIVFDPRSSGTVTDV